MPNPRRFALPYEIPSGPWKADTAYRIQRNFEALVRALTVGNVGGVTGSGAAGTIGPAGPAGVRGPAGLDGQDGDDGMTIPGPRGLTGAAGATGATGAAGARGSIGPIGMDGEDGQDAYPSPYASSGIGGLSGAGATGETVFAYPGNPQAVVSAPIGSLCRDLTNGYLYRKLEGAGTAYGWYRLGQVGAGLMGGHLFWSASLQEGAAGGSLFSGAASVGPFAGDVTATFTATGVSSAQRILSAGRTFGEATSGAVSGNTATINTSTTAAWTCLDDDLDLTAEILTDSDLTNLRIWFGLSSAVLTDTATLGSASNGAIAFRYSTAEGDTGWMGVTQLNGAGNQTVSAQVAAIAASTIYRLRIRFVRSGTPTVYFSVNGGPEIAVTTNIPATGNTYFVAFGVTTKAAVAKKISWRAMGATIGA